VGWIFDHERAITSRCIFSATKLKASLVIMLFSNSISDLVVLGINQLSAIRPIELMGKRIYFDSIIIHRCCDGSKEKKSKLPKKMEKISKLILIFRGSYSHMAKLILEN
jgi:hypothetical protein